MKKFEDVKIGERVKTYCEYEGQVLSKLKIDITPEILDDPKVKAWLTQYDHDGAAKAALLEEELEGSAQELIAVAIDKPIQIASTVFYYGFDGAFVFEKE